MSIRILKLPILPLNYVCCVFDNNILLMLSFFSVGMFILMFQLIAKSFVVGGV